MKFTLFVPAVALALFATNPRVTSGQPNLPTVIGNIVGPGGVQLPISVTLLELMTPNNLTILHLTLPVVIDNNELVNVSVLVQLQTHSLSGITLYVELKLNGEILIALPISLDLTAIVGLLGPGLPIEIPKLGRRFIQETNVLQDLPHE